MATEAQRVLGAAIASVATTRPSTWRRASITAVFTPAVIFCDTCWVRLGFLLSLGANASSEPITVASRSDSRPSSLSASRRTSRALSRRPSSSLSGTNALVQVSTAVVRVSMKFSSSGNGVPSP